MVSLGLGFRTCWPCSLIDFSRILRLERSLSNGIVEQSVELRWTGLWIYGLFKLKPLSLEPGRITAQTLLKGQGGLRKPNALTKSPCCPKYARF